MDSVKKTALHDRHEHLGAKMVEFAGWRMPVEYQGLRQEHLLTREKVGLFDVSHMGEIRLRGPEALASLEWLTTNDVGSLKKGQAQYTLLTNFEGGVVDDLIIYCLQPNLEYLLCVNASNIQKDFSWILAHKKGETQVIDESSDWGQIAVQGPRADELATRIFNSEILAIPSFEFRQLSYRGNQVILARTGYTGEKGFEIFVETSQAASLWDELLDQGKDLGVTPVGLGARDTLRTEMKYPLYGHELDDHTNPYEAGLGWVIKPDKKDFIGRDKIVQAKKSGLRHKLIGFKMLDRGIARQGYRLFSFDNEEIGKVTSGTVSPSLGENIGIGYVRPEFAGMENRLLVEVRGRKLNAVVTKTPFIPARSKI